jgi:hypothetical protein
MLGLRLQATLGAIRIKDPDLVYDCYRSIAELGGSEFPLTDGGDGSGVRDRYRSGHLDARYLASFINPDIH